MNKALEHVFTFLNKDKHQHINAVRYFLTQHDHPDSKGKTVQMDQGNELAHSSEFCNLMDYFDFTLEVTAPQTSTQNTIVKRSNSTLS